MISRRALVVGFDDYPKEHTLYCCVNDAKSMKELLAENGNGSANFDVQTIINRISEDDFHDHIGRLFASDDADVALFYFSGHGYEKNGEGYIVIPTIDDGMIPIPMKNISKLANQSKIKNKVIILDCCFSGAFGGNPSLPDKVNEIGNGVTILTACRPEESAVEIGRMKHGVFTSLLLAALEGGAANVRGMISPASVHSFIDQSLGPWDQRPLFKTNVSSLINLRSVEPEVNENIIRNIRKYFKTADSEFSFDPSYEFTNSEQYVIDKKEPYAIPEHVKILKQLQKLESVGLVEPVGEEHMYFAAMNSKSCRLTILGKFYWELLDKKRF